MVWHKLSMDYGDRYIPSGFGDYSIEFIRGVYHAWGVDEFRSKKSTEFNDLKSAKKFLVDKYSGCN